MDLTAYSWTGCAIRVEEEESIFGVILGLQDAGDGNARHHQQPQGQSEERGAGCDHAHLKLQAAASTARVPPVARRERPGSPPSMVASASCT